MRLKILTDNTQWARICRDYWLQDRDGKFALQVRYIAERNDMTPRAITKLVKQNAYVSMSTSACSSCKGPYGYYTRSEYLERHLYAESICKECSEATRKAITEKKTCILAGIRQEAEGKVADFARLDLKSTIYLLATIQALGDEQLSSIEPLNSYPPCALSPDSDYDQQILRYLIDKNLLLISMVTAKHAIVLLEDGGFNISIEFSTFDLAFNQYQITELHSNFHNAITLYNIRQTPELVELCREIQLSECAGFLAATLKDYQLAPSLGEKTQQVFGQCLERFSVAQIYTLIENATRDTAADYMRGLISKAQAANSVVGAISRNLEQSLVDGPEVKPSNRSNKRPQSLLSRMIFNTVLGTDDGGFKQPLYELIQQKSLLSVLRDTSPSKNTNQAGGQYINSP